MLNIFIYAGLFILFLNFVLFLRSFSLQDKAFKIFTVYLGVILVIQIVSNILSRFNINNLYLSHFYFVGQFIVLSFFYKVLLQEAYQKKIVTVGLFVGLAVIGIQYMLDPSLFLKFNLFEIFITSFLIINYAALHFYNILNEKKEYYYINMGILLYLFGSTILFIVGNLTNILSTEYTKIPWILNSGLYIVYQLFILLEWKKSFFKK
jgi:hypothetical protein